MTQCLNVDFLLFELLCRCIS